MSNKKIIAIISALFGALLLPGWSGGSGKMPITCDIFGNYPILECPPEILIPSTIIGLAFISIAIFLFIWDLR